MRSAWASSDYEYMRWILDSSKAKKMRNIEKGIIPTKSKKTRKKRR